MMKNSALNYYLVVLILSLIAGNSFAKTIQVSNNHDAGMGSFRYALHLASNDSSIDEIRFIISANLELKSSVTYTGIQSLAIYGAGIMLDGEQIETGDMFSSTSSAPLVLDNISFQNSRGNGVVIKVPGNTSNNVSLSLNQVNITNTADYGVYIDDSEVQKSNRPKGSKAGIILYIRNSHFKNNTISDKYKNGIRVDEHNSGGIYADISNSVIETNDEDGIKLNEDGDGDVILSMKNTLVNGKVSSSFISVQASNQGDTAYKM